MRFSCSQGTDGCFAPGRLTVSAALVPQRHLFVAQIALGRFAMTLPLGYKGDSPLTTPIV